MKRLFPIAVLGVLSLTLGGCWLTDTVGAVQTASNSAPSQTVINQSRTTVLGLDNLYGIAVIAADTWAQSGNRCGVATAPSPPLCSTPAGIVAVNKAAVAMRTVLNAAEKTVMAASPTQSDLTLAISSAQTAWSTYQQVLAAYSIKSGS